MSNVFEGNPRKSYLGRWQWTLSLRRYERPEPSLLITRYALTRWLLTSLTDGFDAIN